MERAGEMDLSDAITGGSALESFWRTKAREQRQCEREQEEGTDRHLDDESECSATRAGL